METQALIDDFLAGKVYAVAGASTDREKFGNKILRCYLQKGLVVWPVHPKETEIEGIPCSKDLSSLPEPIHGLSIVTPPKVTEMIVEAAAEAGIKRLWIQPGAESNEAIARGHDLGLSVIAGGPCLLVALDCEH
jgi:uncharacterized protein